MLLYSDTKKITFTTKHFMDFEPIRERKLVTMTLDGKDVFVDVSAVIDAFDVAADCRIPNEQPIYLNGELSGSGYDWTGDTGHKYTEHIAEMGKKIEEAFNLLTPTD